MIKALYGMLVTLIMYYKKFRKDIKGIGLEVDPYGICFSNQMKPSKQQKVIWHVDDLKSSLVDTQVNDKFLE